MRAGFNDKTISFFDDEESLIINRSVEVDHPYRKINNHINLDKIIRMISKKYSDHGQSGYSVEQGLKAMLVQFWEDSSDREMERGLRENIAFKWFCGFGLKEETPDHSYFGRFRQRIGTELIAWIFNEITNQLRSKGLYGDAFTFMDASKVITKVSLWEERDRAIADGYEKLNNQVVDKYANDKDARWGAKSKRDIWYGYKRHCSVDMRKGLIIKSVITPANVMDCDLDVINQICPDSGAVFADKLYDTKAVTEVINQRGCYPALIRKRTNHTKNHHQDRWRSSLRMPFEGTFSKLSKRTRYVGLLKAQFQNYAECLVYNLKIAVRHLDTSEQKFTKEPNNTIQIA